jgi:hypothetical protein
VGISLHLDPSPTAGRRPVQRRVALATERVMGSNRRVKKCRV